MPVTTSLTGRPAVFPALLDLVNYLCILDYVTNEETSPTNSTWPHYWIEVGKFLCPVQPAGMVLQHNGFLTKTSPCWTTLFPLWSLLRFSSVHWCVGCSVGLITSCIVPTVSDFSSRAVPCAGDMVPHKGNQPCLWGYLELLPFKFWAFHLYSNNSEPWSFWIKLASSPLYQQHALSSA